MIDTVPISSSWLLQGIPGCASIPNISFGQTSPYREKSCFSYSERHDSQAEKKVCKLVVYGLAVWWNVAGLWLGSMQGAQSGTCAE